MGRSRAARPTSARRSSSRRTRPSSTSSTSCSVRARSRARRLSSTDRRRKVTLRLSSPSIAVADLKLPVAVAAAGAAAPAAKAPEPAKKGSIFSDAPVSFAGLAGGDVDGDITIGELKLDDKQKLADVHARFTVRGAHLDANELQAKTMGGTVHGSLKVDATQSAGSDARARRSGQRPRPGDDPRRRRIAASGQGWPRPT